MKIGNKIEINFWIDQLDESQYMAYGKIPWIATDVVFAQVTKTASKVETVFTLSEVVVAAEKAIEDIDRVNGTTTEAKPEEIRALRIKILTEFLNLMVKNVLLEEVGATKLELPIMPWWSNEDFRAVHAGINSADESVFNMLSKKLILSCE